MKDDEVAETLFTFSTGGMKRLVAIMDAGKEMDRAMALAQPHLDGTDELSSARTKEARLAVQAARIAWRVAHEKG